MYVGQTRTARVFFIILVQYNVYTCIVTDRTERIETHVPSVLAIVSFRFVSFSTFFHPLCTRAVITPIITILN